MAKLEVSQKKWKYLSFALMGILATGSVGLFVPQASAHITNGTQHMLEHIYKFAKNIRENTDKLPTIDSNVVSVKAKTNNLPADPASQLAVDNGRLTSVVSEFIATNVNNRHSAECSSDKPYVVNLVIKSIGAPELTVGFDPAVGGGVSGQVFDLPAGQTTNLVFPRNAGDTLSLTPFANGQDIAVVYIFMQTQPDATASCSVS